MTRKEELLDGLRQLYESGEMETEPYQKARAYSDKLLRELEQSQIISDDIWYRPVDF